MGSRSLAHTRTIRQYIPREERKEMHGSNISVHFSEGTLKSSLDQNDTWLG